MAEDEPWNLGFAEAPVAFESATQRARVWTEGWVAAWCFCPSCGAQRLDPLPANNKVGDFRCAACAEEYELKAQKSRFGARVVDGAYGTMAARLAASNNPNLMLMRYDAPTRQVSDLIIVPKHFFVPEIIEKRPPLAPTARRAGWVGCNILIGAIPAAGRIAILKDGRQAPKAEVLDQWRATLFLRDESLKTRGWLIEVMKCIELMGRNEFTLNDVYAYEPRLSTLYPDNRNVRPKIRQQLQVLRDRGFLEFDGGGKYRRIFAARP